MLQAAPIPVHERARRAMRTEPPAIAGATLSCLIAAKMIRIAGDRIRPFSDMLDQAISALDTA